MKLRFHSVALVVAISLFVSADLLAQAPKTISYQGFLTDNNRDVVSDGNYNITFRIYDQAGGGTALWTESKSVEVASGVFTAVLGQLVPLNLPFNTQYWLGVSVSGTTELSPRTTLTASPYSLFSSGIADGAVTGSSIANNSITANKLNRTGASSGDVLTFDGTNVTWGATSSGLAGVTAGVGLVGGGSTGTVSIRVAPLGIDSTMIAANAITDVKVAPNSISGEKMQNNTIKLTKLLTTSASSGDVLSYNGSSAIWAPAGVAAIPAGSITATELANNSVTNLKIGPRAVTAAKIAAGAVGPTKIDPTGATAGQSLQFNGTSVVWGSSAVGAGSIGTAELAALSVTTAKIAALSVTTGKLAAGAVTTGKLAALSVTPAKISTAGAATADVLRFNGTGAVWGPVAVGPGSITNTELALSSVDSGTILDGSVAPVDIDPTGALAGEVLKFDGVSVTWGADLAAPPNEDDNPLPMAKVADDGSLIIEGDLRVSGNVEKGAGSFKIDHPLDPENKYLYHSFVESDDMMNIYNGTVHLDENGEAIVQMPDWFEALNSDFRYQLTTIGGYAPVYILTEIQDRQFVISGGTGGLKVSWQVTGVRKDPYSIKNRIPVEQDKPSDKRGTYLHKDAYEKQ